MPSLCHTPQGSTVTEPRPTATRIASVPREPATVHSAGGCLSAGR